MRAIDSHMHEIRRRFVKGILHGMQPHELRAYVTGFEEDSAQDAPAPAARAA